MLCWPTDVQSGHTLLYPPVNCEGWNVPRVLQDTHGSFPDTKYKPNTSNVELTPRPTALHVCKISAHITSLFHCLWEMSLGTQAITTADDTMASTQTIWDCSLPFWYNQNKISQWFLFWKFCISLLLEPESWLLITFPHSHSKSTWHSQDLILTTTRTWVSCVF